FFGIIIMEWIRFVLIPFLYSLSNGTGDFDYLNPTSESLKYAINLMIFELIITYGFFYFLTTIFTKRKLTNFSIQNTRLKGSKFIYWIYIIFSFAVLLFIGIPQKIVRFLYIDIGNVQERIGDNDGTLQVLVQYIITSGSFILFILVTWIMYKRFNKHPNAIYYYVSLFVALFNVSIIVGERRTAQIYIAIVTIYILIQLFPKYKGKTIFYVLSLASLIIIFMSIYKFFGAFMTGSYIEAVSSSNKDIGFWSKTFQSYFFGPENVAASLEFGGANNLSLRQFLFDFFRSVFGINFFLDKNHLITSQIFNLQIYNGLQLTGHVISAVGYGVIYFGAIFSPVIACFNILVSFTLEILTKKTNSLELKFLFGYLLIRFCTNLYVNSPALIGFSSIILGTTGLVMLLAITLKKFGRKEFG
ncbi:oligosaccharide repeat unit polymerase, partial [Macrococcoides canis]